MNSLRKTIVSPEKNMWEPKNMQRNKNVFFETHSNEKTKGNPGSIMIHSMILYFQIKSLSPKSKLEIRK
ncbi:hypothetical protein DERP_011844 [Dermatophagoides pteronyssinus]|uniref:Uncharacterized protein n=1 Tax=Dermatophagoides pteronyssinus TaxID=6956 RepID=A0ABQ8JR80_DERPT|nr:hypothetical protein DERP_011844 [Dermatophagoides pteronyssinus]